ncbi:MAG TPA: VCBS repeat-containing protein, partial [Polyangia bacterium]|nr:VCBS repeat-containing protein [Polyangia bacterium]
MRRIRASIAILALAALSITACGDGGSGGDPDAGDTDTNTGTDTGTGPACTETAAGEFPPGAVEIAWEETGGDAHLLDFTWNPITGSQGTYTLGETAPMWENIRFDLAAPATVYGARVQWGNLVGEGVRAVGLAAHDDFGSNGFDFWQWDALRSGDRCLTPEDAGQWIDYVFDEPIEIPLPGLIHIAHLWSGPDDPLLLFDSQTSNDCNPYDGCHSAFNWPEAESFQFNGMTLLFPYDYAVRLVVELHDTIPPGDRWFQVDGALSASSRVAWGDYDGDGDDDLMTNGPTLYRNNGDGTFSDVTEAAGLTGLVGSAGGGVWGDFDNDGCLDYFGLGTGQSAPDVLLRNLCDGSFQDVTLASGIWDAPTAIDCVAELEEEHAPTEGAAWVDLDSDGFLDLYLAQYECGGLYVDYVDQFWHNEGDGTFTDGTEEHGFLWATARAGRGVSPADCDRDGDVDIFVSNYRLDPNFLFINEGDGTVYEWAEFAGLAGENVNGSFGHTIGAAWADFDGDGDFDVVQANLAHPRYYHFSDKTMVLMNDGAGNFAETAAGIWYRETHSNPTVADFDNDGDWDVFSG